MHRLCQSARLCVDVLIVYYVFFFFNDTATAEIYTLSLHDALPISWAFPPPERWPRGDDLVCGGAEDRKSTRLNSSHANISYAVFCLKKKPPMLHVQHGHFLLTTHLDEHVS